MRIEKQWYFTEFIILSAYIYYLNKIDGIQRDNKADVLPWKFFSTFGKCRLSVQLKEHVPTKHLPLC